MGIMLILSQNVLPGVILKGHSNPELNNGISVYGMRLCSLNLKKGGGIMCIKHSPAITTRLIFFGGLFYRFYSIKTYQKL